MQPPIPSAPPSRRATWSWVFYDWANSAFATVVVAGFFPIFFRDYWSQGVDAAVTTQRHGLANGLAGAVIALSAPFLGAIADYASAKRRMLFVFMVLGLVGTASLSFVPQGGWVAGMALFVVANMGFMGANVFYDALLVVASRPERYHFVSGLGFGMGYLGGGVLFAGCVAMTLKPDLFGLAGKVEAVQVSFIATAIWWGVFAIPLFLWLPEPPAREKSYLRAIGMGLRQVRDTLGEIGQIKHLWVFLLAYWIYMDGVHTVYVMAVSYGQALGFKAEMLIVALLLVQFVGFPAAIFFGHLGERLGPRRGIYIGLGVYTVVSLWGIFLTEVWEFFAIAVLVGLVQGAVQSLSRSFYATLIPPDKSGEFFGFYNLLGKFATLVGPPLFGLFGVWFGQRYSMLALIIMFAIGALVLTRVKVEDAKMA